MKLLSPALFCSFLFLSACGSDEVSFRPDKGDSRQYQLYTKSQMSLEAGGTRQSRTDLGSLLVTYEIEEVRPHLRMLVRADYLQLKMPGRTISSSDRDESDPQFRELMAEGIEFDIDLDSGALLDIRGRHREHWDALIKEGGERFVSEMRKQLNTPALLERIPAKVGAELKLSSFQGSEDLLLRVEEVSDEEVLASIQLDGEQARAYGYLRLERNSGWLRRLAMVAEQPFDEYGFRGTTRTQFLMLPAEQGVPLSSLDVYGWDEPDAEGFIFPAWEEQSAELPAEPASEAQVFPSDVGSIEYYENVRLEYLHALDKTAGHLEFRRLQALDDQGEPLDLQLFGATWGMTRSSRPGEGARTMAVYLPLGWQDTQEKLEALQQIRLQADYFPYLPERLELPVDPQRSSRLELDGAGIELSPTGNPGEFILSFSASEKAFFSMAVEGLTGAQGWLHVESPPADWLTLDDARLLRSVAAESGGWRYRVKFADDVPKVLGVHLLRRQAEAQFSRELQFLSGEAQYDRLDLAPQASYYLHADPSEQIQPVAAPFDLQTLALEDAELNRLRLTLTTEQAALCQLQVLDAPSEAGHALTFLQAPAERDYSGGLQLPATQQWQLRTDDGVRQYFYGIELRAQLRCSGRASWNEVEFELGERPWLIDPRRLPGYVDEPGQRAASFLSRYRFVDESGRALTLLPATSQQQGLDVGIAALSEYLTEEGLLRLAGTPVRVEQLRSDGEPLEKTWTTRLAPLP
ncbi:hypothetical protein [Pseudomonas mangrovi]|uniref:Lipoprotein n=1 Tax=Pseudomonas mangrovi TaxID=2161748 RepID=A0A2T5P7A2_9PSED|nr:hypothetical protein [Pseudomonas mangrovi]PTU73555.1 hypothetical protein DBO85_14660 [Pseudomonas mangrovi]